MEQAFDVHWEREEGEEATGATERWVEIMEDPTRPGPIRDVKCWVVEFSGDGGPTVDLYLDWTSGEEVKREQWG